MEKFNFIYYTDSIKKIKCIYTFNDRVNYKTMWEGFILTENVDGLLNIEGYEKDNMDSNESHFRFINGKRAISYANESLIFEIYPGKMCPIQYDMHYNEKDGCFYGIWYFVPYTKEHPCVYNNIDSKCGEAIIRIEDGIYLDEQIIINIKKLGEEYKKEYAKEMEYFDNLAFSRFISDDDYDKAKLVKRLSMYSNKIR